MKQNGVGEDFTTIWDAISAIGSILSGLGTIAGAVAVAWTARVAFRLWKKQKVEEQLMDVAGRVLTLSYRLEAAATQIRSQFISSAEAIAVVGLEEASHQKVEFGDFVRLTPSIASQVIIHRINEHKAEWDELISLRSTVLVHFGEEVDRYLTFFLTLRGTLQLLASELRTVKLEDERRRSHLIGELFARQDDALSLATSEALSNLQRLLLPKLQYPGFANDQKAQRSG